MIIIADNDETTRQLNFIQYSMQAGRKKINTLHVTILMVNNGYGFGIGT